MSGCDVPLGFDRRVKEQTWLLYMTHCMLVDLVKEMALVHLVHFDVCSVGLNAAGHILRVKRHIS